MNRAAALTRDSPFLDKPDTYSLNERGFIAQGSLASSMASFRAAQKPEYLIARLSLPLQLQRRKCCAETWGPGVNSHRRVFSKSIEWRPSFLDPGPGDI